MPIESSEHTAGSLPDWLRRRLPGAAVAAPAPMSGPQGRLMLDLVPESAWGVNLRSLYPEHWAMLRRDAYRKAGHRCECCEATGRLECHEVWDYQAPPVQRLVRLIALCPECHGAMHYGMARVRGVVDVVDAHMMKVNGWARPQLVAHVRQAFLLLKQRNAIQWRTDTSVLDKLIANGQ